MKLPVLMLLSSGAATAATPSMRAHFVDVDQGAATLLEFPCGFVMIDAGGRTDETSERLADYVSAALDRRSDLPRVVSTIFVTHTHSDHNRALRTLLGRSDIAFTSYVHNGILEGSGRHAAKFMMEEADAGKIQARAIDDAEITKVAKRKGLTDGIIDPVACKPIDPQIRVLSGRIATNPGWPEGAFDNGNNQSLVIRVDFGEASFLFTGDLEDHAIETLVEYYAGTPMLDVDVYQVGHHGSHNGTTDSLMAAMSPRIAVISMSPWNVREMWTAWAYGHPRAPAIAMLERGIVHTRPPRKVHVATGTKTFDERTMKDAIYATGWDGTIVVFAYADGRFMVRREK
jgi:beta-lactamase superfamily II metal-dependent hydrolase